MAARFDIGSIHARVSAGVAATGRGLLSRVRQAADLAATSRRRALRWFRSLTASPSSDKWGTRLSLWFGVLGFVCILLTSMATASLLSHSMTQTWVEQDEHVLRDFVQSAVTAHRAEAMFKDDAEKTEVGYELEAMFRTIASRDRVFLAHFYAENGMIFWSTDPVFIGRRLSDNEELAAAFAGKTVTEIGELGDTKKAEHALVDPNQRLYVETYIPIFGAGAAPIGVIELYRTPKHLQDAIDRSTWLIWVSTLLSGLALYLTLGWIARWGDHQIERSAKELAENKGLTAIGEVATAVAHGLRNPLAAMRSSAELALDAPQFAGAPRAAPCAVVEDREGCRNALQEVVKQVDRLDSWIRALVGCLRTEMLELDRCDAKALLRECAAGVEGRAELAGLSLEVQCDDRPLPVQANRGALIQLLDSLVANAIEATPKGGSILLIARPSSTGDRAVLEVRDTGPGPDESIDPFEFYLTTKGAGLGVGLPIARRLARRHHGELTVDRAPEGGAIARLRLPLSRESRI